MELGNASKLVSDYHSTYLDKPGPIQFWSTQCIMEIQVQVTEDKNGPEVSHLHRPLSLSGSTLLTSGCLFHLLLLLIWTPSEANWGVIWSSLNKRAWNSLCCWRNSSNPEHICFKAALLPSTAWMFFSRSELVWASCTTMLLAAVTQAWSLYSMYSGASRVGLCWCFLPLPFGEGNPAGHCLFLPLETLTVPGHPGQVTLSFQQESQDLTYSNIKTQIQNFWTTHQGISCSIHPETDLSPTSAALSSYLRVL